MLDLPPIPEVLEDAPIFAGLDAAQLGLIADLSHLACFDADDVIFTQGSISDELYVVASGEVDIQIDASPIGGEPGERPVTITTVRRGDSFGEIALVDQGVRSAAARCGQSDTWLVVIPRRDLVKLCEQHPRLGYNLMRNLAIDLALTIRTRTTDFQIREFLTWTRGGHSGD